MSDVTVSISCLAFNHAPYIRECLDGFLSQKTNFRYEVIIHDDASTDGTADIIREYQRKYPDIFFPIYQDENQYSKGVKPTWMYNAPRWKGKYIAICEGDDYWTDSTKLQKQVDFLDKNNEFSICFHKVKVLKGNNFISDYNIESRFPNNTDGVASIDDLLKNGNFINTASVLFRKNSLPINLPIEFKYSPVGDYLLYVLIAQQGLIKRLDIKMAVYRRGVGVYSTLDTSNIKKNRLKYQSIVLPLLRSDKHKEILIQKIFREIDEFEHFVIHPKIYAQRISFLNLIKVLYYKIFGN